MNRQEFLRKTIQIILITILAAGAIFLGKRSVVSSDCSLCSGSGICKGDESDCSRYVKK